MRDVVVWCSRLASAGFRCVGVFLIGVGFVASAPVLGLGWLAFYVLPSLITGRSGASPTLPATSGSGAKHTGAPFSRRYDEVTRERLEASSGSSSGKPTVARTSTFSPAVSSTERGLQLPGLASATAPSSVTTWLPERASKDLNLVDRRRSATRGNTLLSKNRSNCRPCSWIRALVGGGESPEAVSAGPRVPQSQQAISSSNEFNGPGITFWTRWKGSFPPKGAAQSTRLAEGAGGASTRTPSASFLRP